MAEEAEQSLLSCGGLLIHFEIRIVSAQKLKGWIQVRPLPKTTTTAVILVGSFMFYDRRTGGIGGTDKMMNSPPWGPPALISFLCDCTVLFTKMGVFFGLPDPCE
eukprot:GHVU01145928.1.p7 GENE.GHVU01145928.1~~GHVU01145928.1.p7  ORF type:complete len:105 (+),score=4.20 GHVU01145928.1:1572-1886(+)